MQISISINPDFIDSLANIIKNGERKEQEKNIADVRSRQKAVKNIKFSVPSLAKELSKKPGITFFDQLLTDTGFNEFIRYITNGNLRSINPNSREDINQLITLIETDKRIWEFDHNKTYNTLSDILTNLTEYFIYDLFAGLGLQKGQILKIKELYLIVLYVAAYNAGETVQYLYLFGEVIFSFLAKEQKEIGPKLFKNFTSILGIPEKLVRQSMINLGLNTQASLDFDMFQKVLFAIFLEVNTDITKLNLTQENLRNKQFSSSVKQKNTAYTNGCSIF